MKWMTTKLKLNNRGYLIFIITRYITLIKLSILHKKKSKIIKFTYINIFFKKNIWVLVPGLEPGPRLGQGFKPCMSTNSII